MSSATPMDIGLFMGDAGMATLSYRLNDSWKIHSFPAGDDCKSIAEAVMCALETLPPARLVLNRAGLGDVIGNELREKGAAVLMVKMAAPLKKPQERAEYLNLRAKCYVKLNEQPEALDSFCVDIPGPFSLDSCLQSDSGCWRVIKLMMMRMFYPDHYMGLEASALCIAGEFYA